MARRKTLTKAILVVAGVAPALLFFAAGCSKEEPTAKPPQSEQMMGHAEEMAATAEETVMAGAIEQKTCPVMEGNPINPNIFVEYKGKKVYFCCAACPEKFKADPEKYLSKLPQFQE